MNSLIFIESQRHLSSTESPVNNKISFLLNKGHRSQASPSLSREPKMSMILGYFVATTSSKLDFPESFNPNPRNVLGRSKSSFALFFPFPRSQTTRIFGVSIIQHSTHCSNAIVKRLFHIVPYDLLNVARKVLEDLQRVVISD